MSNIYKNQTSLRIQLTTNVNISGSTSKTIDYRSPRGTTGSWIALVSSTSDGVIYRDIVNSTDLFEAGYWKFRAHVIFSDGRVGYGDVVKQQVKAVWST